MAAAYSASKAAVIAMTKAIGKDLVDTGILVNSVAPAVIETPILDQHVAGAHRLHGLEDSARPAGPRRGGGEPGGFLASEDTDFTTGACFDISGGRAVYLSRALSSSPASSVASAPGRHGCSSPRTRRSWASTSAPTPVGCTRSWPRTELEPVTLVQGDMTARAELERALDERGVTRVIHLAALQIPFCRADPSSARRQRRRDGQRPRGREGAAGADRRPDRVRELGRALRRRRRRSGEHDEQAEAAPARITASTSRRTRETPASTGRTRACPPSGSVRTTCTGRRATRESRPSRPTRWLLRPVARATTSTTAAASLFNYTADVARALVAMSRSGHEGAAVCNMPGSLAHMGEVVAAIEAAAPGSGRKDHPRGHPVASPGGARDRWPGRDRRPGARDAARGGCAETVEHFRRREETG